MIIVRRNENIFKSGLNQFDVYLKLPDGSEHEIPGVIKIIQMGLGHILTIDLSVDDRAVKFEDKGIQIGDNNTQINTFK